MSPFIRDLTKPERFLYVWSVDAQGHGQDFLAVIDVDITSPTYGQLIERIEVGSTDNEPHHMGFTDDRTHIWAASLFSNKIFIFHVASNPAKPRLVKVIDNFADLTGLASPHTVYAIPGRMIVAALSNAEGGVPTGLAEFTNDGKYIRTLPFPEEAPYGYDIAIKPKSNLMVTSSFTPVRNYRRPMAEFDFEDFGDTVMVWDFKNRKILQVGKTDKAPLEVRWALRSGANYGFVNALLGNSLWLFRQKDDGSFEFKKIADTGRLPADLRQSPDDRYLYVSSFLDHQVEQWDVSDPDNTELVSVVRPGLHPNMMHVTWDGKRMYVTNSLLSTVDFGAERYWVRLVHIGPDGMKMDPFFDVDFSNFPTGPARPHDMLLY